MNITHYAFGKITIDGREYTSDVIVFANRVHSPWLRKEGYKLYLDDLPEVLTEAPMVLVIGTGYFWAHGGSAGNAGSLGGAALDLLTGPGWYSPCFAKIPPISSRREMKWTPPTP
jgi:hypothetical protein